MSLLGEYESQELYEKARTALLDALDALGDQRNAVILIGAQAIYMHTGKSRLPLAEYTTDADLALNPNKLHETPLIEIAMTSAGFKRTDHSAPGAWVSSGEVPVDLLVPEQVTSGGRRGARIPPHSKDAARKTKGIEACLVDNEEMAVSSFLKTDSRQFLIKVAGPAALLVAKTHKIADRANEPTRLKDKDAHDCYRILQAIDTETLSRSYEKLANNELSRSATIESIKHLNELFALSTDSLGCQMAARAEQGIGDPQQVAISTMLLSVDLLNAIHLAS